ncbi:MAG: hypothetical protein LAO08_13380 [Acidobacteriia bacterium]|nr:hypothetical protein [Terriglobia bacterium]
MIGKLHVLIAVLGTILAASLAGAQSHGAGVSNQTPFVAVRPVARISGPSLTGFAVRPPARRPASTVRVVAGGHVVSGFAPPSHSGGNQAGIGVPGLGFDYPHLAAISGGLQGDAHRGFDRGMHSGQGFLVPIFFGGYPYYFDSSADYEQPAQMEQPYPAQQQPQIIVIQQPVSATSATQAPSAQEPNAETSAGQSSVLSSPAMVAPARNVAEIILIRKDGRVLFASAFSVVGSQLRYISPEGILQKFPVTELDSEATQQMNEARGNSVEINN